MDGIGMILICFMFGAILLGGAGAFLTIAKDFRKEKDWAGVCLCYGASVALLLLIVWCMYMGQANVKPD